jgi:hypothetical protein
VAKNVIAVPEKYRRFGEAVAAMLSLLEAFEAEVAGGAKVDYAGFERALGAASAKVERAGHEAALRALDIDGPAITVDGVRYGRTLRGSGTYYTLAGPVVVERTLYRPPGVRNGKTVDAISLRIGAVGAGWLPETAQAMAHQVQSTTSREAEANLRQVGRLPYSRTSFEEVAHLVGERYLARHVDIEEALIAAMAIPYGAKSVCVSLDRVSVPMEEPRKRPRGRPRRDAPCRPISRVYRMAYTGCVTLCDSRGRALHTIRYGTMPQGDPVQLCAGMAGDVARLIAARPNLDVVLLCDGAPEMWNLVENAVCPNTIGKAPVRLVDLWHVVEKLGKAVALTGGGSAKVDGWKLALCNRPGAGRAILRELRASGSEWVRLGDEHPVHDAITYLENHADRMHYADARSRGLPVGSGNVEATCKSLVEVRMKRPGSRWKHATGERLMHLRALALSDRWTPAMRLTLATEPPTVRAAA